MKSGIAKRSVIIDGRKTSISLEDKFWSEMEAIAAERKATRSELVAAVDHDRSGRGNLSSALRCFVLARYYRPTATTGSEQQTSSYREPQQATP